MMVTMIGARLALVLCTAAMVASAAVLLSDDGSPEAGPGGECVDPDRSYTTDSLHDLRSLADALAIVRGVRQSIPPEPDSPEGWAGLIGRRVTANVERVVWRRPHAPEPPARMRFDDIGWAGTLEHRRPIVVCRATRMKIGRRYLAAIVRDHGTWYPIDAARLRLRGDLVVGGVDGGEPDNSHQALAGRTVRGAARQIAEALPYRSTVLQPGGGPARRWQRAYRDDFRLWGDPKGVPVIVTSGVTPRARWQLYLRLPARGGMCVGLTTRGLWHSSSGGSGEGCGARTVRRLRTGLGLSASDRAGVFAYGHTGRGVFSVRVRFEGEDWRRVDTLPTPIPPGGRGRFWVVPATGDGGGVTVQAIGRSGHVVDERRIGYAASRSG
jgi:hypothetical protein